MNNSIHPDDVLIGERDREDYGDLSDLRESIKTVGLLHPIVITANNDLIAGGRRLAAVKELGWDEVPVTIVDWSTVENALRAEADENTCRKPLTPYEASKARQRRARVLSEDAATRTGGRGNTAEKTSPKLGEVSDRHTAKLGAVGTGYSGSTLDKVDRVVKIAEEGTVTVGRGKERRDIPVPPEVQEIASQHIEGLKQTGAAVDAADKAVSHALETFIEADPDVQAARYRHEIYKAFSSVRRTLLTLDPSRVAELLEDMVQMAQLQDDINKWFSSVGIALRESDVHSAGKAL